MLKLKKLIAIIVITTLLIQPFQNASAQVLISEVKIGDDSSARKELIEIYNDNLDDVEITNWCMQYITSSFVKYKLSCFIPSDDSGHLFLPSQNSALAVSNEFLDDSAFSVIGDISFSARLSGVAGYVSLIDNYGNQVDDIGWGEATIDNDLVPPPTDNLIFKRKINQDGFMQDTDIYRDDFEFHLMKNEYSINNIYEIKDLCSNIDGIQDVVPEEHESLDGECSPIIIDVCLNIDGVQNVIPDGFLLDDNSNCINPDLCLNLSEIQLDIPDNFFLDDGNCYEKSLPINITEIFPNAVGSDDGLEFIELYNPNSINLNLGDYEINVNGKKYDISQNQLNIEPYEHKAFYNFDINFNLLNSSSELSVYSKDSTYLGELIKYQSPKEGESWSLIDGLWQYTNQPTPNDKNLMSKIVLETKINNQLKSCGPGQYRNPETNRCKNIISSNNITLKPCEPGYERNPETNRCRKISSILGDSDLKPCNPGYERNPETNRCRKIVNQDIPSVGYEIEQTNNQSDNGILITSVAGVGTMAVGYGLWEWRKDFLKLIKKITNIFHTNN